MLHSIFSSIIFLLKYSSITLQFSFVYKLNEKSEESVEGEGNYGGRRYRVKWFFIETDYSAFFISLHVLYWQTGTHMYIARYKEWIMPLFL